MTALPIKTFRFPTRLPAWLTPVLVRVRRRPLVWGIGAAGCLGAMFAVTGGSAKHTKWNSSTTPPVTAAAVAAPFLQEVVERGEVESSSNVEIRCLVQSRSSAGTAIIQIVPEGAYVKEGEFLVKLDDSGLRADLVMQQIASNTSRAAVVGAQADFDATKLALQEYESGTFRQAEEALESEEFVAKENLRRAEEYLRYSEKLAARGYVTEVQLEADRFAVEKARKELGATSTKLEVLHRYTKLKTVNRLKADVETMEARLKSLENSHKLDLERQKTLEEQLANCVIKAPTSGQVVYANPASGEPIIAEGKLVRERQIIIRLPDPKRMHVIARVNESRIDRVKKGMPVRIRLDAFPEQELQGTVRDISEYPLPAVSSYSTMKEYAAEIDIHEPPPGVRSGMTAQASIEIEKLERAVQVPLPAVLERGKRFFCLVTQGDQLTAQEVSVGPANDQAVIIENGLNEGDQVLLAPQAYESSVTLPDAVASERPQTPEARAIANAAATAKSAAR